MTLSFGVQYLALKHSISLTLCINNITKQNEIIIIILNPLP